MNISEISYVIDDIINKKESETVKEAIEVKGSHGTKIEAIVRKLIQIASDDPEAKSLIFSQVGGLLCN